MPASLLSCFRKFYVLQLSWTSRNLNVDPMAKFAITSTEFSSKPSALSTISKSNEATSDLRLGASGSFVLQIEKSILNAFRAPRCTRGRNRHEKETVAEYIKETFPWDTKWVKLEFDSASEHSLYVVESFLKLKIYERPFLGPFWKWNFLGAKWGFAALCNAA